MSLSESTGSLTPHSTPIAGSSKRMEPVALLAVEVIDLVAEVHVVRQRHKAVAETAGDVELALVLRAQLHGHPLQIRRGALAQIDGHVHDRAARDADDLRLRHGALLEVDAAQRALLGGEALVVLHGLEAELAYFGSDHVSMNQPRWSPNTSGSMIFTSGIFVSRIFIVFHLSQ